MRISKDKKKSEKKWRKIFSVIKNQWYEPKPEVDKKPKRIWP